MGYGMAYDGNRPVRAHRLAWINAHGQIPDGLQVHHVCGQKLCVNVDHLQLVTIEEHAHIHHWKPLGDSCPNGHPFPESLRPGRRECAVCTSEKRRKPPRPPRTHCLYGHEYTPVNTSVLRDGARRCLTCHRERAAIYKARDPERVREVNRRATKRYYEKHRQA